MVVDFCDPNGDVERGWVVSEGVNHFAVLNEGVRQPAVPDSDNIAATDGDENDIDRFYMDDSIQDVDEVTSITIWIYGNNTTGERCSVDLYIVAWRGYQVVNMDSGYGWFSKTFDVLCNQAQLDAMQVRFKAYSNYGKMDGTWIRAFYAEVTYSEVVVGYAHKFLGIASNKIGKVCGVPTANIGKIKGV